MRLFILFFVLSLPALCALGFDLWLTYGETMDFRKPLQLSSVGWLWVKYAEENYNLIRSSIDPDTWASFIRPVLSQKLVTVALLPVVIAIPVLFLVKIFSLRGQSQKKAFSYKDDVGNAPRKQMKYKRR